MQLIVRSEDNTVVAVEVLDPLLEDGTFAVRLDAVSRVLDGIRVAANTLIPDDSARREANPARMARLAQTIMAVSASAKALAEQAKTANPDDKDAATVLGALNQLHL